MTMSNLTVRKMAAMLCGVVVIVAAVYLYCYERKVDYDTQRERQTLEIAWRIMNFDHAHHHLPADLSALSDGPSGDAPNDPKTGRQYEYAIRGKHTYELCAVFSTTTRDHLGRTNRVLYGDPMTHGYGSWFHGSGRQCMVDTLPIWKVYGR